MTSASLSFEKITGFLRLHAYFFIKTFRAVLTAFLILALSFIMVRASGNPADIFLGSEATQQDVDLLVQRWGLDQPLSVQFVRYVSRVMELDFGNSLVNNRPVRVIIMSRIPATLSLMIPASILSIIIGIFSGTIAAIKHRKIEDIGLMIGSTLGFSLPNFFFGVLLIFLFSVLLGWLPSSGNTTLFHYIMPLIAITTSDVAVFTRYTRAALLDILNKDFITSFRALGTNAQRILLYHALPNASISLLTISGFYIGSLVSGAIVTETIFAWPGLGSLLVSSVRSRDFPLVQGLVLLFGISIVIANLTVDILYGVMDPRIRKGYAR